MMLLYIESESFIAPFSPVLCSSSLLSKSNSESHWLQAESLAAAFSQSESRKLRASESTASESLGLGLADSARAVHWQVTVTC